MQLKKAQMLRQKWAREGNKECEHPELDELYYLGAQDWDKVCIVSGQEFDPIENSQSQAENLRKNSAS